MRWGAEYEFAMLFQKPCSSCTDAPAESRESSDQMKLLV